MQSPEYPDLPFVRPAAWGSGRDGNSVQYIVVHYTAGSEGPTAAMDGALYDARRTDGTSTHYFVDRGQVVQCVETWNRANAAFSIGNRRGIQYELCGTQQTRAQWLDPTSDATITNAARQIARDCKKYGLPVQKIGPSQMNAGVKGICGHADVTLAYGLGDHMDPGTEFPYDVLLQRVNAFLTGGDALMALSDADADAMKWRLAALVQNSSDVLGGPVAGEDNNLARTLARIETNIADLQSRAQATATPVDAATLKAALQDPAVMAVLVDAAKQGANQAEDA